MKYYLMRCLKCDAYQMTQTDNLRKFVFHCFHCRRSTRFWDVRRNFARMKILKESDSPQLVSQLTGMVKEEMVKA